MCLSLTTPSTPALSQAAPSPPDQSLKHASGRQPYKSNQLQGDERILHALNRFTFGPRQGDLEAVRAMGLDKWFNQQLHPATLDQAELNARLDQFPAMQLDLETLLFRFPSNAIIRQVADGKAPIPKNPALMAIYDNQLARVEEKRQEKDKQNQQQASIVPNAAIAPMAAVSPQDMAEAMIQTTDQPAKTHNGSRTLPAI